MAGGDFRARVGLIEREQQGVALMILERGESQPATVRRNGYGRSFPPLSSK
jgi:hypothetical protein